MSIFSFLFSKKGAKPVAERHNKGIGGGERVGGGNNELDFVVVGQGLAGTLLAFELEKRGKKVLVIDDGWKTAASMVAAGVLNPVTGMRITKTLGVDDLLPAAKRIYAELGEKFGETFFHEIPFYRFYSSEPELATKAKRAAMPEYAGWISDDVPARTLCGGALADALGGFFVNRAGWLDLPKLLATMRADFRSRGVLLEENFDCNDLKISRATTTWRQREIRGGIIFCTGFRIRENPWFGHLKWQPAKGEFVKIEAAGTENFQAQILKSRVVAIPLGGALWRVGTNYDRDNLDCVPTPETGERLVKAFCAIFSPNLARDKVRIVGHVAGVRPAVAGALPKVGAHENFPKLFLFNGFGSKGVTWIPLHAERFAEKICK
ncbi:MAG: FAD-binding oxidoreductase [Opitutae bacterium]|nr:FAD-binding oxidoreductase [Opitutae bacterium]